MTASKERRREVLELAKKYNFLILEGKAVFLLICTTLKILTLCIQDDPYYYLYYGKAERPPSYFSLELELGEVGRVLRFDSLSKVLSAGIRIGFSTGPKAILDVIDLHVRVTSIDMDSY